MRNVLVTGASRGLGLAVSRRLVADGFRVIGVARRTTEAFDAAAAAAPEGALVLRPFDLGDVDGLAGLVKDIRTAFGPIFGLVNNAGLGTDGLLTTMSLRDMEALVRLNTLSPMALTKAVVRGMMAKGEGRVVNMSSIVASHGYQGLSVYSATKASLLGFTRALARELGPAGITVNAVAPGFVDTEMTHGMDAGAMSKVIRQTALRRMVAAEDVAAAVAYLMGDGGRNVTGAALTVDAGTLA